jgi:hypothetical protein
MAARLEPDIEGRAARRCAGIIERLGLGMRAAAGLRPAAADNYAVAYYYCSYRGVRRGPPERAAAEGESRSHEVGIVGGSGARLAIDLCG